MITYCLHQMLILQHASLFQICNAVTISSEIKSLPFHTVAPNLHEKRRPSDKMKRHGKRVDSLKIKAFSVCRYYTVTAFPCIIIN